MGALPRLRSGLPAHSSRWSAGAGTSQAPRREVGIVVGVAGFGLAAARMLSHRPRSFTGRPPQRASAATVEWLRLSFTISRSVTEQRATRHRAGPHSRSGSHQSHAPRRGQPFLNSMTLSIDLLTVYKVARGFESLSLRQRVFSFRCSPFNCGKNAHSAGIRHPQVGDTFVLGLVHTRALTLSLVYVLRVIAPRPWHRGRV